MGLTVTQLAFAFGGSNPSLPTKKGVCQNPLVPALDAGPQKSKPYQSDVYMAGFNAIPHQARNRIVLTHLLFVLDSFVPFLETLLIFPFHDLRYILDQIFNKNQPPPNESFSLPSIFHFYNHAVEQHTNNPTILPGYRANDHIHDKNYKLIVDSLAIADPETR